MRPQVPVMGSPWHCSGLGPGGGCLERGLLSLLGAAGKDGCSFVPGCSELSTGHGPAAPYQAGQLQDTSLRPGPTEPSGGCGHGQVLASSHLGHVERLAGAGGAPLTAGLQHEAFNEGRSAQK